jgi:putative membrane protein
MPALSRLLAHADDYGHHMDWGGGWWWMLIWGTVMMIVIAGLIAWLIRYAATAFRRGGTGPADPLDGARQILAERYARGELTSKEYRERVDRL